MDVTRTRIPDVLRIQARAFQDDRGLFAETWQSERYEALGIPGPFVQDNLSRSKKGVLRGLHMQVAPAAQGKLVSVVRGSIWDVAVDVRKGSPTFCQWVGEELSADNFRQLWIPPGFAHGFLALEENTIIQYKCTAPYHQESEVGIRWDDKAFSIAWPEANPLLSPKDAEAPSFDAVSDRLPHYVSDRP